MTDKPSIGVILLAGGVGKRMKTPTPKQFLLIEGKPVARYSFDLFIHLPQIDEIVVVCEPRYCHYFQQSSHCPVRFALPGSRRQDSVQNGLKALETSPEFVCVHDSARPFIDEALVQRVLNAGIECGASTVGMPLKFTVKECDEQGYAVKTLRRDALWEVQTPQLVKADILKEGFAYIDQHKIDVTDDTSIAEILGHPVKVVEGSYQNFKITTAEDMVLAKHFMKQMLKQAPA